MKKQLMAFLLLAGFASNSIIIPAPKAFEKIKKLWDCGPAGPKTAKCSKEDRIESRNWLIGTSVAVLTIALAAVGIGAYKVKKARENAIKEVDSSPLSAEQETQITSFMEIVREEGQRVRQYFENIGQLLEQGSLSEWPSERFRQLDAILTNLEKSTEKLGDNYRKVRDILPPSFNKEIASVQHVCWLLVLRLDKLGELLKEVDTSKHSKKLLDDIDYKISMTRNNAIRLDIYRPRK